MRHNLVRSENSYIPLSALHHSSLDKAEVTTTQTTITFVTGPATDTSVSNNASSTTTGSSTSSIAIIAGSAAGGGVALLIIIILLILVWKRRRKSRMREPRAWSGERMDSSTVLTVPTVGRGQLSQASGMNSVPGDAEAQGFASSVPDMPPQIPITPGWPRRPISEKGGNGWPSASEKRREERGARQSRLLDDTQFEDILAEEEGEGSGATGRQTPSILEAENGSVVHSTAPSRATSQRTPSSIRKVIRLSALTPTSWRRSNRTRATTPTNTGTNERSSTDRHRSGVSSLWSWSHRATRSEYDGESLPAYTVRRSQSTTRSGQRSRRSSTSRFGAMAPEANPPGYPVELARKVAQAYPRMPASPGFPPPPFEVQEGQAGQSQ